MAAKTPFCPQKRFFALFDRKPSIKEYSTNKILKRNITCMITFCLLCGNNKHIMIKQIKLHQQQADFIRICSSA